MVNPPLAESEDQSPENVSYHKLWIDSDWYILVNDEGYCVGECAEGALGFVIRLQKINDRNAFQALKIPRLLGDTYRENAYVCELTEQEGRAVQRVFGEGESQAAHGALLQANVIGENALRGPINTTRGTKEARDWNDALILVSFTKSQNPQFCLVKKSENSYRSFPLQNPPIPESLFEKIEQKSVGIYKDSDNADNERAYQKTVFIVGMNIQQPDSVSNDDNIEVHKPVLSVPAARDREESADQTPFADKQDKSYFIQSVETTGAIFAGDEALNRDPIGKTWYAGIPSITYGWAPKTFQQTISTGERGLWDIRKHLQLIEHICGGLRALHSRSMLHADVRPANIVIQGKSEEPLSYRLSDYGSFSQLDATREQFSIVDLDKSQPDIPKLHDSPKNRPYVAGSAYIPTSGTLLGPVVVGERASAFYAPERRLGREREAADIAIIWQETPDQRTVILGWKSDLLDDHTKLPNKDKIKSYISKATAIAPRDESQGTVLEEGDRIQVREYIFELAEAEKRLDDKQIFVCKYRYWLIYHGRIAVESTEKLGSLKAIPVPRTVELLKWSVSTDMYSLGALTLYSVFRQKPESTFASTSTPENSSGTTKTAKLTGNDVEDQFREMLAYLTSVSFFNAIWPDLDWLRHCMERELGNGGHNEKSFAEALFQRFDGKEDKRTLRGAAIEVTKRITQTTPGVQRLVEALDYNVASFIFLFHFAFCCLHRQSHLKKDYDENVLAQPQWESLLPFCENRREMPGPDGASATALKRLETIRMIVGSSLLRQMTGTAEEIGTYDPKPEISVRIDRDRLRDLNERLVSEIKIITAQADTLAKEMREQFAKIIAEYDKVIDDAKKLADSATVLRHTYYNDSIKAKLKDARTIPSIDTIAPWSDLRTNERLNELLSTSSSSHIFMQDEKDARPLSESGPSEIHATSSIPLEVDLGEADTKEVGRPSINDLKMADLSSPTASVDDNPSADELLPTPPLVDNASSEPDSDENAV